MCFLAINQHILLYDNLYDDDEDIGDGASGNAKICMNTFEQVGSLNNHKLTHSGEKKTHKCAQCSKLFARAENLRNHMMTHTGEKSLKCAQCGKSLNRAADLKKSTCSSILVRNRTNVHNVVNH